MRNIIKNLFIKLFETTKAHKSISIAVAGVVVATAIAISIELSLAGSDEPPIGSTNSSKAEASEKLTVSKPSDTPSEVDSYSLTYDNEK